MTLQPKKPEIVDFRDTRFVSTPLKELNGKIIIISEFKVEPRAKGEIVIVKTQEGNEYYTFSKVVRAQLENYKDIFRAGKMLRAKVVVKNNVVMLAPPT